MTSTTTHRTANTGAVVLAARMSQAAYGGVAIGDVQTTGSARSAAASAIDPCAILSPREVNHLLGTTVTVRGPAVAQARGRTCTWDFHEAPGGLLDAVGDQAQQDLDHATVLFSSRDDVVQLHVPSPTRRDHTLAVAQAAAGALE